MNNKIQFVRNIKVNIYNYIVKLNEVCKKTNNPNDIKRYKELLETYKKINGLNSYEEMIEYLKGNTLSPVIKTIYDNLRLSLKRDEKDSSKVLITPKNVNILIYKLVLNQYLKATLDSKEKNAYNFIVSIYNETKDKTTIKEIVDVCNKYINAEYKDESIKNIISQLNRIISGLSVYDKKGKKNSSSDREINVKEEKDKKENTNVSKAPNNSELNNINRQLISYQRELTKLHFSSKEATEIRKKIYDLCEKRTNILKKYYTEEESLELEANIESYERQLASAPKEKDSYTLSTEDYLFNLGNAIDTYSNLKLYGIESSELSECKTPEEKTSKLNKMLLETTNNYYNLVTALYGQKDPVIEGDETAQSLFENIGIIPLDASFNEFVNAKNTRQVGGVIIDRKVYNEKQKSIKSLFNKFYSSSLEKLKSKGNKVVINETNWNTKSVEDNMNKYLSDIYAHINSSTKANTIQSGVQYSMSR